MVNTYEQHQTTRVKHVCCAIEAYYTHPPRHQASYLFGGSLGLGSWCACLHVPAMTFYTPCHHHWQLNGLWHAERALRKTCATLSVSAVGWALLTQTTTQSLLLLSACCNALEIRRDCRFARIDCGYVFKTHWRDPAYCKGWGAPCKSF